MDQPTIDHRGPEFFHLSPEILERLKGIFKTSGPVLIYPTSGSGAAEAALVNCLSSGDHVLLLDHGFFASNWGRIAERLGLEIQRIEGDWRKPVDPEATFRALASDTHHRLKAVLMVHNETSTGVCSRVDLVRDAIDRAAHPALLIVDTISSLGAIDYRHSEWGVDVTIGGSQKGLMLPPGLGFNAVSEKALDAHRNSRLPKSFWDWGAVLRSNQEGSYPYTPATNLLYGLKEALLMLEEEGLDHVFERHSRLAAATRAAVKAWGLEICCLDSDCCSASLTTVLLPEGFDSDRLRALILNRFDLSLGTGLGELSGRAFRIGHLGSMNDLMLAGTLCGIEMGLQAHAVPFQKGGVSAALDYLLIEEPDPR